MDGQGLSSYPHPWLMPDYWQFPTVSMGLGPIQAIYQAHVMKYLDSRELINMGERKVWAFLGDGECDEPETLGSISLAGREKLDNLIFVVNCNLQRLDGPVRGNGKIIQELEGIFRGAGWNVLKVVWGADVGPALRAGHRMVYCSGPWTSWWMVSCRTSKVMAAPIPASISSAVIRSWRNWLRI